MQTESLNIAYHVQRLVVKALNKHRIERDGAGVYVSKAKQTVAALIIILIAHCTPQRTTYNKYQVRDWFKKLDECTYIHPVSGDTVVLASDGLFHIKK